MRRGCQGCQGGSSLPFDFTMAFHPILDVGRGKVWGYEALVRGTDGQGAGQILAMVDENNRYRFDQACRVKAIELASSLFPDAETRLSINFMPNAVYEPAACIRATLDAAQRVGFAHRQIMFEFTENERMTDVAHVRRIIAEYRKQGFATALDDFGAGYAGLNLLANFQPDFIKLDMELIRGIADSPQRQTIVAGVVVIAERLNIAVIAEGVETEAELASLRSLGIDLFQGYLFAKPTTARLPEIWLPAKARSASRDAPATASTIQATRAA
ncbi:EAL domain-containing protein [Methylobacterium pseudosasicola]|uniref:EAL domain, c-di-GMP-specific phosphodiesterase class I (Or its enzymatically inactive variant) n=1 Tax=Methylobacterium pseudosasicola TaxID=582667 RepID=A0A1I4V401_9HYPH|nr:EAL domain-containing protein [Methylobacterium pseudosasicola]SFM95885.1 EAL domain, c-di-GMP-specific phosphodiesterase class I (or its enzymatically inactive variant) [Methylobacterium pseudosasicola]